MNRDKALNKNCCFGGIGGLVLLSLLLAAVCWPFGNVVAADQEEASETPNWEDRLGGDWGGLRKQLYGHGISLQFVHKSDVLANVSGGIEHGVGWMGHTEAALELDMEKLLGWDATTAYFQYQSDLGDKFNSKHVGGFVGVDNIEVATNTAQFNHAWVQKGFFAGNLSLLFGLYPIDSEFYVTDTSALFLQPPYGMANDLAQTGVNGPPIFPLGALAARVKYITPDKRYYLQGAVTDGVPGDPERPRGTHVKLGDGDGALSIVEFGITPQESAPAAAATSADRSPADDKSALINKIAIGFWRYSARFDDLIDIDTAGNPLRRHSQGAYFLAERTLLVEHGDAAQGIAGFVRFGMASKHIHQADWTGSLGLRFQGLIPHRDDDAAGIAVTFNHASSKYRRLNRAESYEIDFEATYQAQIKPWLLVQPNLQYIINPGMDPTLKNATIIGFRTEMAF